MSDELNVLRERRDRLRLELQQVEREIAEKTLVEHVVPPPLPVSSGPRAEDTVVEKESMELRFGRFWMVRIGIVLLITGFVLIGNLAWREFMIHAGPPLKLAALFISGGLLAGAGIVLKKTSPLTGYARVLTAGGVALLYYGAYAAHFVPALRVISNAMVAGIVLLGAAVFLLWIADRERSQAMASMTILLAFYAMAIHPVAGFPIAGSFVLAVAAVVLSLRHGWTCLSVAGVVACYMGFAYWRVFCGESIPLWQTVGICAVYWVVFQIGIAFRRVGGAAALPLLALLNNAGFVAASFPWVASAHPEEAWAYLFAFGGVLVALSFLGGKNSSAGSSHLGQGLALVVAAVLMHFSGLHSAIFFAISSVGALRLSRFVHRRVLQIFSGVAIVLGAGRAAWEVFDLSTGAVSVSIFVALVAALCGWLFKCQRSGDSRFRWRAVGFFGVACALLSIVSLHEMDFSTVIYSLCGGGMLTVALGRSLRLPEAAAVFQCVLGLAAVRWIWEGTSGMAGALPAAVLAMAFLLCALLLPTWIPSQLHAFGGAVVVFLWAVSRFDGPFGGFVMAMGVLAFVAAGKWARPFAVAGEVLAWGCLLLLCVHVLEGSPWPWLAVALALLVMRFLLPGFVVVGLGPESRYRIAVVASSGLLALLMLQSYTPDALRLPVVSFFSVAALLVWHLRRSMAALITGLVGVVSGSVAYLIVLQHSVEGAFPPFVAGCAMLVAAAVCERDRNPLAAWIPAVAGTFLLTKACGDRITNLGAPVTVAIAIVGFVLLGAGFVVRRRTLRLPALGILLMAVVRVFVVDVWTLPVPVRIVSFFVLGGGLMALGFVYNRYSEVIRRWL